MLKADEYYIKCEVVVLAKATGGQLPIDGGIVKLYYDRMLKIKDYGLFEPEGWEYEIDEVPLYDLDEYEYYTPCKMYIVRTYSYDLKVDVPNDLKVLEVYKADVLSMDTESREEL